MSVPGLLLFSERLPRYERARSYPPIKIGRPKQLILEALGLFTYLSAQQVCRFAFSRGSLTYVQDHLKDLFHAGFVRRVFLPTITPHGSSLAVYCLDNKGLAHLKSQGRVPEGRFHAKEQAEREWLFLRHTLACNDLLISAHVLSRERPSVELAALRTEHQLKRAVVYVEHDRERIGVAPDGWIDLRHAEAQTCLAWELDRGTVERKPFQRKIRGFLRYADGPYQEEFGTESLTIVFVTTSGPRRLTELVSWTEKELTDLEATDHADLFWFAEFDPASTGPMDLFFGPRFVRPFDPEPLPLLDPSDRLVG